MQSKLDTAALAFASKLAKVHEPSAALNAFDAMLTSARSDQRAYAAWRTPQRLFDWNRHGSGVLLFKHPSVPVAYWPEFFTLLELHGVTIMAKRAWLNRGAFTFSECMRETSPRGEDRWLFDLLYRYGIRDGYYVPAGPWMVVTWSPRVLRMSSGDRASLEFSALHTARWLEFLTRRNSAPKAAPTLTTRELQVVQRMSIGDRLSDVAEHLHLSLPSVRTYERRARKKLNAKTPAHMVAEAMRVMLLR